MPLTSVSPTKSRRLDVWLYPEDFHNDMKTVDLPLTVIHETLSCAWEYTRCVIPHFTNWARYIAFTRIIAIGIVCEFRGEMVNVSSADLLLGYNLSELLDTVFGGCPGASEMAREYRAFLLLTAEKCSEYRTSNFFRRYVNSLAASPRQWFRLRDCDALARFTMVAALRCNDVDEFYLSEGQWEILAEIGDGLYDAVAFHKHRAEGETHSTFGYIGHSERTEAFRRYREVLWALDAAWARSGERRILLNFIRPFGGPIHMMMRRYRFVEDGLVAGKAETEEVVEKTRKNVKLWNRVDQLVAEEDNEKADGRYEDAIGRSEQLLFPGLKEILAEGGDGSCSDCHYRTSYGARSLGEFGGVELCDSCRADWRGYVASIADRTAIMFPELKQQLLSISKSQVNGESLQC